MPKSNKFSFTKITYSITIGLILLLNCIYAQSPPNNIAEVSSPPPNLFNSSEVSASITSNNKTSAPPLTTPLTTTTNSNNNGSEMHKNNSIPKISNNSDSISNSSDNKVINNSTLAPLEAVKTTTNTTTRIPTTTMTTLKSNRSPLNTTTNNNVTTPTPFKEESHCYGHRLLEGLHQPKYTNYAKIKKCCPMNESLQESANGTQHCAPYDAYFEMQPIEAVFYDRCIEDNEVPFEMDIDIDNPCSGQTYFVYSEEYEDMLYVLQNGSLLRISKAQDSYDVFDEYCLDINTSSNKTQAIVCNQPDGGAIMHISKIQAVLFSACMIVSIPFLLITAYLYLRIKEFQNVHGRSLACHCICLAIGYSLLSIPQIIGSINQQVGFAVQYFILACFFWLCGMCVDIAAQVWYYIPRRTDQTPKFNLFRFIAYFCIAMGIPLILILLSIYNQLEGIPSYYLKGITESTRESQRFFIPPISSLLFCSFALLVASFFGFRWLKPRYCVSIDNSKDFYERQNRTIRTNEIPYGLIDHNLYDEVRSVATSTTMLFVIMAVNWIFEIISFYVQTAEISFDIFDILNGLQGLVIFTIFVTLKKPLTIIKRWYKDSGSLDIREAENEANRIHATEMQPLRKIDEADHESREEKTHIMNGTELQGDDQTKIKNENDDS